jgi:hypothetical protein
MRVPLIVLKLRDATSAGDRLLISRLFLLADPGDRPIAFD